MYLNTPEGNWTFNPLSGVAAGQEALATAELIEVFKKYDWAAPFVRDLERAVAEYDMDEDEQ